MNTPFTPDRLRTLFQNQFNSTEWLTCLQQLFLADELRVKPEPLDTAEDQGYYWGAINTPDHYHIGLFHYAITRGSVVNRRVGLRKLVEQFTNKRWGDFDAALVVFSSRDHWRLSLICDIDGEATSPKRFTYVFGSRDLLYRTPIERFTKLQKEGITFAKMREAFSVEALSDEFFERYREQYADFVQYVTGKRYVKSGSKWEERVLGPAHAELISAFKFDEKRVRDYIKKMMGRITFLHFLQRKGWMCGDLNYMQHLFERSPYQDDYLDAVLEPLFFGILNTRPEEREALFAAKGWNKSLLSEWNSIPYLNGGLFECEVEDLTACHFPADYFRRLFQFFSEYNFTIDENDPTDAEVGVDPEMLGKIFENLLEDNKDKGAFYTPKEIVRYMCRESLIAYLVTQSMERGNSNPREKVEASIRDLLNKPEEIVPRMNERQKREFGESLYRLKICDPAIGSGAFPMGLLNELVRLRALIDAWAKNDNGQLLVGDYAALKSEIICNNIYGVDIERGAIDIARLRFWLSIVVDEVTPHTLPNLDYKFMQGNSLITTFNGEYINLDSKQNHANIVKMRMEKKRLYQLKQQYYTATGEQKHQLNVDIKDSILSLIALQLDFEYRQWFDHHNTMHYLPGMGIPEQLSFADIKQNLPADKQRMCDMGSSLRRQLHDETKPLAERAKLDIRFFDWRMMFTEVFEGQNPGFDIVIGNPPYIKEYTNREAFNGFRETSPYYMGKMDLWYGFACCGLDLLRENGILTLIAQNNWTTSFGAAKMRKKITQDAKILQLIDFNDFMIFEDSASIQTMIMMFQSDKLSDNYSFLCYRLKPKMSWNEVKEMLKHKKSNSFTTIIPCFKRKNYESTTFSFSNEDEFFNRIKDNRTYLQENEIAQGIVFPQDFLNKKNAAILGEHNVGDGVFALSNEELISMDLLDIEYDLIKPYYTTDEIHRYYVEANNHLWMIYTNSSFKYINSIIPYPNIKKHLDQFTSIITSDNKPYGLHRSRNERFFKGEKIIALRKCSDRPSFSYSEGDCYVTQTFYSIKTDRWNLKFLTGILNSKLIAFWLKHKGKMQGEIYQIDKEPLTKIPLPNEGCKRQPIENVVDRILAAKKEDPKADTTALEAEIDQLVYQLYGLTDEEIAIIEKANE